MTTVSVDAPTRPNPAVRRARASWRGGLAVALSLATLAACICASVGLALAESRPSLLERYVGLTPGQTSLFRVTYADGSQGYYSANVVHPSGASVSYATIVGGGGRAVQIHNQYTNWQGSGQVYIRDDHYARHGDELLLVGHEELIDTYLYDPAVPAWSPDILVTPVSQPLRGETRLDDVAMQYRAWRGPDETRRLPDGRDHPAVRFEVEWRTALGGVSRSTSWYVSGIGLVQFEEVDERGALRQRLELLTSTALPDAPPSQALLAEAAGRAIAFFREDAARTGAHPDAVLDGASLRPTYRLDTEAAFTAPAVVADGLVYAADQTGQLVALEAYQAVPRWQFTAGGAVSAAPAVVGGIVYFGAGDKYLYALEAGNGLFLWRYRVHDNVATSPVVAGGTLYFAGEDRTLYALDAITGVEHWRFRAGDRLVSAPAVADGRVLFGGDDGVLYALEAGTGALLWRRPFDSAIVAAPAVAADGAVYVATTGGEVSALDLATGDARWSASTRFGYDASPALGPEHVYVADNGGSVRAYAAASGDLAWEWRSPSEVAFAASPLLVGGTLLAVDTGGVVYAFAAEGGALLSEVALGGDVTASPTWTGEAIWIATQEGDLVALQSDVAAASPGLALAWQYPFDTGVDLAAATLFANPVLVGTDVIAIPRGGTLVALDAATGASRSILDTGEEVLAAPAVDGELLYLGTSQGTVLAFDLGAGQVLWETHLGGLVRFAPALDGECVYVHTIDGARTLVRALERATGAERWSATFSDGSSTPVLFEDFVIVSGEAIAALDRETGSERWRGPDFAAIGTLALYDGSVYAGGTGGDGSTFLALDAATGEVRWSRADAAGFGFARPGFDPASGNLLAAGGDGQIWAYAAATGELRWRFQADSTLESDVILQDGAAYFTARSGMLYVLDAASGRLLDSFRDGADLDTYAAPLVLPDRVFTLHGPTLFALRREAP